MTDKEKIEKAIEIISKTKIDEHITPDEVYKRMKDATLYDIAEELAICNELVCDLRDVLEVE